ncbi:hypothetical protein KGY73_09905 [bacterium]|nr:hypothetical protein [bacterium]
MKFKHLLFFGWLFLLWFFLFPGCQKSETPTPSEDQPNFSFEISFSPEVHSQPITGRVYIILSQNKKKEPRFQVSPTGVPFFGKNIHSLEPGKGAVVDESVFGYPVESIRKLPKGTYYLQGFINLYTRFDRSDGHTVWLPKDHWEGQKWNRSPGNLYSSVRKVHIDPSKNKKIQLVCDQKIPPVEIPEDPKWVKRIKFQSEILTEFWGQPMYLGATVLLPKGYEKHPEVRYPVNYIQGHFSLRNPYGFTLEKPEKKDRRAQRRYKFSQYWLSEDCPRMIAVTLQHPCPYYDDSYAVNSENVGPYRDAIMKELIPKIEEQFRIIQKPYARILSGGSTGGWISFALQVFHPDFFGGTFSLCPDPLDFRAFQIVNIYKDSNAYYKKHDWFQVERPCCRLPDGSIRFSMEDENHYEMVIGDKSRSGGQWDIWEAAFGPVGKNGYPQRLWDKKTGKINPKVAQYMKEHYDLRYYLEKNWTQLGPKLKGKLHVYTGTMDSYYLNNGVHFMEEFLEKTKNPYYEGTIEYGKRKPHCWGPRGQELIQLIAQQVTQNAPPPEETKSWKYK